MSNDSKYDLLLKGGMRRERVRELLGAVATRLEALEAFDVGVLEAALRSLSDELSVKAGDLFGLVRVAVTGRTKAPGIFDVLVVLGREKTLERLNRLIQFLE